MFEKIVLRRSSNGPAISIGDVAEALLFYQNVHLVLDYGSLNSLLNAIHMDGLLNLLSRKNVTAVYCEETLGISTTKIGAFEYYRPVAFWISGSEQDGPATTRRAQLIQTLTTSGYDKKQATKFADSFVNRVPLKRLAANDFIKGGVVKAATTDFLTKEYSEVALRKIIEATVGAPVLDEKFRFEIYQSGEDLVTLSNVDIQAINDSRKRINPQLDEISRATFLSEMLNATADTHLAAHYGGELQTSAMTSSLIRLRHELLLRKIGIDRNELTNFHEIILPDSPMLSEVINSGERSFDEFLMVLDKSQKFRDWMKGVNPDEKLVAAYLRDVTADSWLDKFKGKGLRYVLGNALNAATGTLAGLAIGAADAFLIDKIFKGWRPSHFVNKTYKPFIRKI
ncbi:hypothetical protein [Herbaspirillum huttiense]|uniref:Uncharacterized protein n=2 Tax=Herbaspirillum huttiense TaxID=863372 RepID=A0AAJ2HE92_9BURK|nr:hypothetical protein [Herbaspirillum huttiense]MDR9839819.1 hypothetical protein [Herbaspirillum huttiense]